MRKNKETTECDKNTVTCDVSTTHGTIKCDVLVTWYSRLLTSGYRTPKKKRGMVELTLKKKKLQQQLKKFPCQKKKKKIEGWINPNFLVLSCQPNTIRNTKIKINNHAL